MGTQILKSTLEGYKTCLFAHGQSQSGKTYTLVGQESDPGLLPRLLEALFQQDSVLSGQLAVSASFYEIKDEQVRDILKQDFYSPGGLKVSGACCAYLPAPTQSTFTSSTDPWSMSVEQWTTDPWSMLCVFASAYSK